MSKLSAALMATCLYLATPAFAEDGAMMMKKETRLPAAMNNGSMIKDAMAKMPGDDEMKNGSRKKHDNRMQNDDMHKHGAMEGNMKSGNMQK